MLYKIKIEVELTKEQFGKLQAKADVFGHGFDNPTPKVLVTRYLKEAVDVRIMTATQQEDEE